MRRLFPFGRVRHVAWCCVLCIAWTPLTIGCGSSSENKITAPREPQATPSTRFQDKASRHQESRGLATVASLKSGGRTYL